LSRGYPLAALLRVRAREAEAAAAVLARALRAEAEARRTAEGAAAERDALARRRLRPALPGPAAAALQGAARFDERIRGELARAGERARAAAEALRETCERVSAARAELARAGRAQDAVERHRERWEALRARARERAEDAATDELAAARGAAAPERP
jgi:hypothetical protein